MNITKKRLELTNTELMWLEQILEENLNMCLSVCKNAIETFGENSQLVQLAILRFDNVNDLQGKIKAKLYGKTKGQKK